MTNKLGIMQPYFFPYIGYWQLINAVDKYIIYDDVNYINRGWINRNRILVGNNPQYINLILKAASQNKKINEIEIIREECDNKIFKTLECNYKKAPYYFETMEVLNKVFRGDETNLAMFLERQIRIISEFLGIKTEIRLSSKLEKNDELKGEDKILNICKVLGANQYYNAIGGKELYCKERFVKENIDLYFLKTDSIIYKQFTDDFHGNLSIVDVMMFNSKEQIKQMLEQYRLE